MLLVSTSQQLPMSSVLTFAAWLCSTFGVFLLATMIPARWARVLKVAGAVMVLAFLLFFIPECEDADVLTWWARGCWFGN